MSRAPTDFGECQFCGRPYLLDLRTRTCCADGRDYDVYRHRREDPPPVQGDFLAVTSAPLLPPPQTDVATVILFAQRYAWLRTHGYVEVDATPALRFGAGMTQTMPEHVDRAIDEAMSYSKVTGAGVKVLCEFADAGEVAALDL